MQSIFSTLGVTSWVRSQFPGLTAVLLVLSLTGPLTACGGSDKQPTDPGGPNHNPTSAAVFDGNNQEAAPSAVVTTPPSVVVKDEGGSPVAGVSVTFDVTAGGGSVTGASATTNSQGVARVGSWTLGATAGANKLTATVSGLAPKVSFTATAKQAGGLRKWTVMVYMAADNDLAVPGILDIDEMEAAGVSQDVQVVVQAEFNPTAIKQVNNCDYRCFNRPNWNTFRYAITGAGQNVNGPNGAATDIGNRNMTDPAELKQFIQWAQQTYPAEHYAVILWNHGGGYTGLLQDITSAGSHLMSMADLKTALATAGAQIDLMGFDMCLMGGYETLAMLKGYADYVVFSEEVVPGEGFPYKEVLTAFKQNAAAGTRTIAASIVDRFHASYSTPNNKASTTISAFDMNGFVIFEFALNALGTALAGSVGTIGNDVGAAAAASQKYTYPELTDIVDFVDHLRARTTDATLRARLDAVKAVLTADAFRIGSKARKGSGRDAADVSRSTGLHIVLPSGQGNDRLSESGPRSLAAYQALYPDGAWTSFLTAWLGGRAAEPVTDFGEHIFQTMLVWEPSAIDHGVDVDYLIMEPDGTLYMPAIGSVTPNGTFSDDSYNSGTNWEGYTMNRVVRNGTYKFYAFLWADPDDVRPAYDLKFRFGFDTDFTWLFPTETRRLSKVRPVANDPNATWDKVKDSLYTDLRFLAGLAVGPQQPGVQQQQQQQAGVMAARAAGARGGSAVSVTTADDGRHPTAAQLATVQRVAAAAHARMRAAGAAGPRAGRGQRAATLELPAPAAGRVR